MIFAKNIRDEQSISKIFFSQSCPPLDGRLEIVVFQKCAHGNIVEFEVDSGLDDGGQVGR